MNPAVFSLVYTSRAARAVDGVVLRKILETSRTNNQRDDITGFLILRDGYFAQFLEGPERAVRNCFERILSDSRHSQIILQGESLSPDRLMPNWSMATLKAGEQKNCAQELLALFDLARGENKISDVKALHAMIRMFSMKATLLE